MLRVDLRRLTRSSRRRIDSRKCDTVPAISATSASAPCDPDAGAHRGHRDDDHEERGLHGHRSSSTAACARVVVSLDGQGGFAYITPAGDAIRLSLCDVREARELLTLQPQRSRIEDGNVLNCLAVQEPRIIAAGETGPHAVIHIWDVDREAGEQGDAARGTRGATMLEPTVAYEIVRENSRACVDALAFAPARGSGAHVLASSVTFTRQGATGMRSVLLLWNYVDRGAPLCSIVLSAPILGLGFASSSSSSSSSSRICLFSASERQLKSWNVGDLARNATRLVLDGRAISACSGSDGATFVAIGAAGLALFALMRDGKLCAFHAGRGARHGAGGINNTGTVLKRWVDTNSGRDGVATCLSTIELAGAQKVGTAPSASPTLPLALVAVGNSMGHVHVFDGETLNHQVSLARRACAVRACSFAQRGSTLVVNYVDSWIQCYALTAAGRLKDAPTLLFSLQTTTASPSSLDPDGDDRDDELIFSPRRLPSWARDAPTQHDENMDSTREDSRNVRAAMHDDHDDDRRNTPMACAARDESDARAKKKTALLEQLHRIKETSWARRLSSYRLFMDRTNACVDAENDGRGLGASSPSRCTLHEPAGPDHESEARVSVDWNIIGSKHVDSLRCERAEGDDASGRGARSPGDEKEAARVAPSTSLEEVCGGGERDLGREDEEGDADEEEDVVFVNADDIRLELDDGENGGMMHGRVGDPCPQVPVLDRGGNGNDASSRTTSEATSETRDGDGDEGAAASRGDASEASRTALNSAEVIGAALDSDDIVIELAEAAPIDVAVGSRVGLGGIHFLPSSGADLEEDELVRFGTSSPSTLATVLPESGNAIKPCIADDSVKLEGDDDSGAGPETAMTSASPTRVLATSSGSLVSRSLVDEYASLRRLFVQIPGSDNDASVSHTAVDRDEDVGTAVTRGGNGDEDIMKSTAGSSRGFGWSFSSTLPLVRRSVQSLFGSVGKGPDARSPEKVSDVKSESKDAHPQAPEPRYQTERCGWARASISGTLRRLRERLSRSKKEKQNEEAILVTEVHDGHQEHEREEETREREVGTTETAGLRTASPDDASAHSEEGGENEARAVSVHAAAVPSMPMGSPPANACVVVGSATTDTKSVVAYDPPNEEGDDRGGAAILSDLLQASALVESALSRFRVAHSDAPPSPLLRLHTAAHAAVTAMQERLA